MATTIAEPMRRALREELGWLARASRPPRLRSMRQFAEEEIVLPTGPFRGRRFRCDRQPHTGHWFDAIDSAAQHGWNTFVGTGPRQSSKTLCGFAIPLVYHLFELNETVILAVPNMDMAADKWRLDALPIIHASRYADLLPRSGRASQGGIAQTITFRNGAVLRFMTGGGQDRSRVGFFSRVVIGTEIEGLSTAAEASDESDKLTAIINCTRSMWERRRVYLECTVTTPEGRIWQEYLKGTRSRLALRCPHCRKYVVPGRENLIGWQKAADEVEARELATFACPLCSALWSEDDRRVANAESVLVHRGQMVDVDVDGTVHVLGPMPRTETFSLKWDAANNQFISAGAVGADEWRAARATDPDNANREMAQFVWAEPVAADIQSMAGLRAETLRERQHELPGGVMPLEAAFLTIGIDLGQYGCHFVVTAWARSMGPAALTLYKRMPDDHRTIAMHLTAEHAEEEFVSGKGPVRRWVQVRRANHYFDALYLATVGGHMCGARESRGWIIDYGFIEVERDLEIEAALLLALEQFRGEVIKTGWIRQGDSTTGRQPDAVLIDSRWQGRPGKTQSVYKFCREANRDLLQRGAGRTNVFWPAMGFGFGGDREHWYSHPGKRSKDIRQIGEEWYIRLLRQERTFRVNINADYWKSRVHEALRVPLDQKKDEAAGATGNEETA